MNLPRDYLFFMLLIIISATANAITHMINLIQKLYG